MSWHENRETHKDIQDIQLPSIYILREDGS